jgi:cholesterol oxidase
MLGRNLITVHPLGGCPMGDDAEAGAVNGFGEVWKPDSSLHTGLFVADGAVIPDSLGVNPLLTISTLAERTAAHILARADLKPGQEVPAFSTVTPPEPRLGLEFSEEMSGYITRAVTTATEPPQFEAAYARGRTEKNGLRFRIDMLVDDIDAFIERPEHEARTEGFVDGDAYGKARRVDRGRFNLYVRDPKQPGVREMLYTLRFRSQDGGLYTLRGHKIVRDDRGFDLWADNTTLFTSIHASDQPGDPIVAQGVMHIGVAGFLKLLSTIKVRNSPGPSASARALGRFGRYFAGTMWDSYISPKLRAGS